MEYDKKLKKWVAQRFDKDINTIDKVSLSMSSFNSGCETCDYGAGVDIYIYITHTDGSRKTETIEMGDYGESFQSILKEIIEA